MQGVPVSHHTSAGRLLGLSAPMLSQENIHLRRAQFRAADDPARCLEAARALVLAKIRDQRTVLRRYGRGVEQVLCDGQEGNLPTGPAATTTRPPPRRLQARTTITTAMPRTPRTTTAPKMKSPRGSASPTDPRMPATAPALRAMQQALRRAGQAGDLNVLRGCEGEAAAYYFAALPGDPARRMAARLRGSQPSSPARPRQRPAQLRLLAAHPRRHRGGRPRRARPHARLSPHRRPGPSRPRARPSRASARPGRHRRPAPAGHPRHRPRGLRVHQRRRQPHQPRPQRPDRRL